MRRYDAQDLLRSFFRRSFLLTLLFAALLAVSVPLTRNHYAVAEYKADSLGIATKFLARELDFDLHEMLTHPDAPLIQRINVFMEYSNLVEFRIWDSRATVVYSFADPQLKGKRFPDDRELLQALRSGTPSTEISEATKLENQSLRGHGALLEMYVPVFSGGRIVGAVEIYRKVPPLRLLSPQNLLYAAAALLLPLLLHVFFHGQFKKATLELVQSSAEMREAYRSLSKNSLDSIRAMAKALEMRDTGTQEHSEQVVALAVLLGHRMGLVPEDMAGLIVGAYLHDVGKIGIPDAILFKPGPLDEKQRAMIETHVRKGVDIVDGVDFLCLGLDVVQSHHERWDGQGYAQGLAGEAIPLTARIFALVDVFDALMSKRPYKEAFGIQESWEIIRQGAGTHFDPRVAEAFLALGQQEILTLRGEVQRQGVHALVRQATDALFNTPRLHQCSLDDH
ncbi:MAG: HD-GYP domain-containing protein [Proteobacteria bacterium]|nr:HD-GYP domain-containing protein [Pseudomonadota bacterium]MBU1596623.1 HD-GYP domain-containing protein [Pseudomonadota bacterium]